MELVRKFAGHGWLKTRAGASTAAYEIAVRRSGSSDLPHQHVIAGFVEAEPMVLVEASSGLARLTLSDGSSFTVKMLERSGREAQIELLPPFEALLV